MLLNFSFTKVAVSFVIYIKVESHSLGHLQGLPKVESEKWTLDVLAFIQQ